jgi:hypothetical protein
MPSFEKKSDWENTPMTERGFDYYSRDLELEAGDLKDKMILDIGAGTTKFAKDVAEMNIGAVVYSLEPAFALSPEELSSRGYFEYDERREILEKTIQ